MGTPVMPKIGLTKKAKETKEERSLDELLGEGGVGRHIRVFYEETWIPAKVITPPKVTQNTPQEASIYIHYMGWKKRYDQWIPLKNDLIKIEEKIEEEKVETFVAGQQVMGTWSDKEYYPCTIVKCLDGAYSVEFYDGFKRKLGKTQVKSATSLEIKE